MINLLIVVIYNLIILVGTAYLVTVYNWSPWWFVLSILIMGKGRVK